MRRIAFAALMLVAEMTPAVAAGYSDLNVALAYFNGDSYADSIIYFDKAIAAGDLIPDQMHVALVDRGLAHLFQNEPDSAISDFTAALAIVPADASTMAELSFAYVAGEQPDKAQAQLAILLQKKPDDIQTNFQVGLVDWQLGRYAEAATAFSNASLNGTYVYPWLWLQLANVRQSNAVASFRAPKTDLPGLHIKQSIEIGWPDPLLSYYAGKKDEASVLDAVKGEGATTAMICEANFYLAEWRLVHGDTAGAKPLMERAAADCPSGFLELRMARLEMKKMP